MFDFDSVEPFVDVIYVNCKLKSPLLMFYTHLRLPNPVQKLVCMRKAYLSHSPRSIRPASEIYAGFMKSRCVLCGLVYRGSSLVGVDVLSIQQQQSSDLSALLVCSD